MPIFYPDTIVPPTLQPFLYFNPPYAFIKSIRYILLENRIPELEVWIIMTAWIVFFLWLGTMVNETLQDDIRDVV